MAKIIGVYKELEPDEKLIFESKVITPIVFIKEAEVKKIIGKERKEVPIAFAATNIYLTNKRLAFLILYQLEAKTLVESGGLRLSGVAGTWFDIPISAIIDTDIRPVFLKSLEKEVDMKRLIDWGIISSDMVERASATEIIYNEAEAVGRIRDYIQSLLRIGFWGKLFKKIERVSDKLLIIGEEATSLVPSLKGLIRK